MELLSDYTDRIEKERRGRTFPEYVRAKALAAGSGSAIDIMRRRVSPEALEPCQKAAVDVMTSTSFTTDSFVGLGADWLELPGRRGVLAQLGAVPAPFATRVPIVETNAAAGWVQEGHAIPASALGLADVVLLPLKLARIVGVSEELLKATDERAVALLDRHLRRAIADAEDAAFLGVAAAVAGVSPAGMFTGNLVFLKIVRILNWVLADTDAAAFCMLPIGGSPAV